MSEATDILRRARALIADPEKWGKGTRWLSRRIDTFCAAEAIEASSGASGRSEAFRLFEQAAKVHPCHGLNIASWNDAPERTHAEVLAAFDKAIEGAS